MKLGAKDASGRPAPVAVEGADYRENFDTIIAAVGQKTDIPARLQIASDEKGYVRADGLSLQTERKAVFAGGDLVTGPASIIAAIAQGRKAAAAIDRYLGGQGEIDQELLPPEEEVIVMDYTCGDRTRVTVPCAPLTERVTGFGAVEKELSAGVVLKEAERCRGCDARQFEVTFTARGARNALIVRRSAVWAFLILRSVSTTGVTGRWRPAIRNDASAACLFLCLPGFLHRGQGGRLGRGLRINQTSLIPFISEGTNAMKRFFETGNFAVTQGAIIAGCRLSPATRSPRPPRSPRPCPRHCPRSVATTCRPRTNARPCTSASVLGGRHEDHDRHFGPRLHPLCRSFGWASVVKYRWWCLNSQRVGSGQRDHRRSGPGRVLSYPLSDPGRQLRNHRAGPNSAQEAMFLTVEAFYLSESFRMPITILADQLITDGLEDISIPETDDGKEGHGAALHRAAGQSGTDILSADRRNRLPPVVLGQNTGAPEFGLDAHRGGLRHRNGRGASQTRLPHDLQGAETIGTIIQPLRERCFWTTIPKSSWSPTARLRGSVKTAVKKAREKGQKIGMIRLISLWPFPDELFTRKATYLSVELNYDGQMVREVQRAMPCDSSVHFFGKCGELPTVEELHEIFDKLWPGEALRRKAWETEAW